MSRARVSTDSAQVIINTTLPKEERQFLEEYATQVPGGKSAVVREAIALLMSKIRKQKKVKITIADDEF